MHSSATAAHTAANARDRLARDGGRVSYSDGFKHANEVEQERLDLLGQTFDEGTFR